MLLWLNFTKYHKINEFDDKILGYFHFFISLQESEVWLNAWNKVIVVNNPYVHALKHVTHTVVKNVLDALPSYVQ